MTWESANPARKSVASVSFANSAIRQLPAPSHLRIRRQLRIHHTPRRAALLHPRIVIVYKHRRVARKQAAAEQTAHVCGKSLGRASFGDCQRRHTCESSGSCVCIIRPTEQRRCAHASLLCINTAVMHENKPRQSKQLMHAAKASVALHSAIASAVTPANPAAAVHTACSTAEQCSMIYMTKR